MGWGEGKIEKLSQTREDQGDVTANCSVGSWMGSWNRKDVHGKTAAIPIKAGVHRTAPMSTLRFDKWNMVMRDIYGETGG